MSDDTRQTRKVIFRRLPVEQVYVTGTCVKLDVAGDTDQKRCIDLGASSHDLSSAINTRYEETKGDSASCLRENRWIWKAGRGHRIQAPYPRAYISDAILIENIQI